MRTEFPAEGVVDLAAHGDARGLLLENNQWGRPRNGASGRQSTWYEAASGEIGWTWDWSGAQGGRVTAYPEVMHGHKPWSRRGTLARIQGLEALAVDYAFRTEAEGSWNAAFEMWLSSTATAHEDCISAEVMVWVARDAAGSLRPCGGDAIRRWPERGLALHEERPPQRAPIYSFVLDQPACEGRIDLLWYLDVLKQWGRIADSDFVCAVEFGNETVNGRGSTEVRRFDVSCRLRA